MDDVVRTISRALDDEGHGETTLAPAEPGKSGDGSKPTSEAELLSREAIAAVGSAFDTLTENEEARTAAGGIGAANASPDVEVVVGRQLIRSGRANGAGRNRTSYSQTLTTTPKTRW